MYFTQTLRSLLRRWYIVLAGLLLAAGAAAGMWVTTATSYERSASQLLLPGEGTIPELSPNPFLYLGGLTQAADVVVRAMVAESSVGDILEEHPEAEIAVVRDPTTAGPVMILTVTAPTDSETQAVLSALLARTSVTLERIQDEQGIASVNRISVMLLAEDQKGTPQDRKRLVLSVGAGGGTVLLTLIVASVVDGWAGRRKTRRAEGDEEALKTQPDGAATPSAASAAFDTPQSSPRSGRRRASRSVKDSVTQDPPEAAPAGETASTNSR